MCMQTLELPVLYHYLKDRYRNNHFYQQAPCIASHLRTVRHLGCRKGPRPLRLRPAKKKEKKL
jgi:hypothetical protein